MSQGLSVYDLQSVKLPRATGFALKLLTALIESPITRPLLLPNLLESGGLIRLRRFHVDEPPTLYPVHPAPAPSKKVAAVNVNKVSRLPRRKGEGFRFNSVADYASAYRRGITTPEVVAGRFIEALAASDRLDTPLKAFISSNADDVMAQARAATKRLKAKKPLSVFDGVPIAAKDLVDMIGYRTTAGTKFLGETAAGEDGTIVARLRAAGAVLTGKVNMHEIGVNTTGLNPHWGAVRNPYNPAYHSGGSSSGSAGAVASGLLPVALGADGGGSIRIPSAYCGLVGLKPTYGRISKHGVFPLGWTVDICGPVAATAEDAALMYAVIAGADPRDPHTLLQPPVTLNGLLDGVRGLTLGVYPEWFHHAAPEVVAACEEMLAKLKKQGVKIKEIIIPELGPAYTAHAVTIVSEMLASLHNVWEAHHRDLGLDSRITLELFRSMTPEDYVHAQRVRTRTMEHFRQALERVDVIVSPSTAITAPRIVPESLPDGISDLSTTVESMRFAYQANLCGLPAISFPAGYTSAGLPVGFQAIGRPWSEAALLRIAYAADGLIERQEPQVYYDLLA